MSAAFDLATVWAFIIAFAVFVYVVMDGFDLGLGILFPMFPAKGDRDVMMNSPISMMEIETGSTFVTIAFDTCRELRIGSATEFARITRKPQIRREMVVFTLKSTSLGTLILLINLFSTIGIPTAFTSSVRIAEMRMWVSP